jgi:hypothetical protein
MSIYNNSDVDLLHKNIDRINSEIEMKINDIFSPTLVEKTKILNIILNFIKRNKRKIYGGYAMNALIKTKDKSASLYKDFQIPDVDFYSPTPLDDLIKICNELHDAGFPRVNGKEAKHKNTYSIFVNFDVYCDITYSPKYLYHKIPIKFINGFNYVHPSFMAIDYLKMITDPMASYWRIEKSFKRFILMQKYFPFPSIENPIEIMSGNNEIALNHAVNLTTKFLTNRQSTIAIGFYAYNYFLNASGLTNLTKAKSKTKINHLLNVPYMEFISTNYKQDWEDLMKKLKIDFPGSTIRHVEYYPFFMFIGYCVEIYIEEDLICVIYNYDNRCLPYLNVKLLTFENNKVILSDKNKINIGTFSLTLLYAQMNAIKFKMLGDTDTYSVYITIVSHLIQMKNYFQSESKTTIFDDTIFKDFVTTCMGTIEHPEKEQLIKYEKRRLKGKPVMYIYDPVKGRKTEDDYGYFFQNISGNEIKKESNMKLTGNQKDDDSDDIIEKEEPSLEQADTEDVTILEDEE